MVRDLPVAAVAWPGVILAAASFGVLTMAVAGGHPMWTSHHLNMSEAAALRDAAPGLQLVRAGESPRERRDIRPGFLFDRRVRLTPLEAAIVAGRSEIVDVLLGVGEGGTWPDWVHARCLAASVQDPATERLLDAHKPTDAPRGTGDLDCSNEVRPLAQFVSQRMSDGR
jgi:hypothetical protein